METDSDDELYPIVNFVDQVFSYEDPSLLTGLLGAVIVGDYEKVQFYVKAGRSVNINDNQGNTSLHIAVIKNNLKILDFLISRDEIVINTRNFCGETPLFLAAKNGRYEAAERLIQAGANVNLSNFQEITPLHASVNYPKIAHLLISNGAKLDASDYSGDMPLHDAITEGCLETVCMFLYYNVDANAPGGNDLTPFMKAVIGEHLQMQEVLFEYVSDFNGSSFDNISTIELALIHSSPYVQQIIERGVVVRTYTLSLSLQLSHLNVFKQIWDRLEYCEHDPISIIMFDDERYDVEKLLDIIIESPNTELLLKFVSPTFYPSFIIYFARKKLSFDIIFKLTLVLLEHSYELSTEEIKMIFSCYGYSELFKLLLYMDYCGVWNIQHLTAKLIFDIHCNFVDFKKDLHKLSVDSILKRDLEVYFKYCADRQMMNKYKPDLADDIVPRVPKLIELARDKSREFIVKACNVSSTCQYYTLVDNLNIPQACRQILKFERKLYSLVLE